MPLDLNRLHAQMNNEALLTRLEVRNLTKENKQILKILGAVLALLVRGGNVGGSVVPQVSELTEIPQEEVREILEKAKEIFCS